LNSIIVSNTAPTNPNHDGVHAEANNSLSSPILPGAGNISADPVFKDYAGGDYRLHPLSPCIDAGSNALSTTSVDLDGNDRLIGTYVDMGAYEQQGSANLTVTKTVSVASPVEESIVQYTITVTNDGPHTATGVALNDVLPFGLSYVRDSSADFAGSTWSIAALPAGSVTSLTVQAAVRPGTAGLPITNTAAIAAMDQVDGAASGNSAVAAITPRERIGSVFLFQ